MDPARRKPDNADMPKSRFRRYRWSRSSYIPLVASLSMALGGPPARACPGVIFGSELSPNPTGPRKGMRLFAWSGPSAMGGWTSLGIQVDPLDADGRLIFYSDNNYLRRSVERTDVMTFRLDGFGLKRLGPTERLPCQGDAVWEVHDREKSRYAYLTACGVAATPTPEEPAVRLNRADHRLETARYEYLFNSANYMQFHSIGFRDDHGAWQTVARDSRLLIRADVKRFFAMNFSSDDVESRLEESRLGPVSNLARLSFFLKILFFKIRMSLSTDVMFFVDSGHIPMMVNIPVNSFEWLHPKSGILYSWELSPQAAAATASVAMPPLDPAEVGAGFESLGRRGQTWCKGGDCPFQYSIDVGGRKLSMDMLVKEPLVKRGFYPQFVDDVARYAETMGWQIKGPEQGRRIGMYFEVSGLPKGGHPWDFWLRLGGQGAPTGTCPAALGLSRVAGGGR